MFKTNIKTKLFNMISLDIVHSTWKDFIKANLYLIEKLNIEILTNCKYYPEPIDIFKVFETIASLEFMIEFLMSILLLSRKERIPFCIFS